MMDFTYNGKRASYFDLRVNSADTFGAPERIVTEYQIPGAMPRIYVQDERKAQAYQRQYNVALVRSSKLPLSTAAIKQWLYADGQYHRLEDTYQPDVYRMARFTGSFSTEWMGGARRSILFPVTFSCQPQLFLKSGDMEVVQDRSKDFTRLTNPTGNIAYPLYRITFDSNASGKTLGIGIDHTYTGIIGADGKIMLADGYTVDQVKGKTFYIDAATEDIWAEDGTPSNSMFDIIGDISLGAEHTFVFPTKDSVPRAEQDATVGITPRWWRW